MPDPRTLTHYQQEAQRYLTQYNQITPPRPRALTQTFFPPQSALIDIGCGSGRDLAWLKSQGHTVEGIEPVEALASACDARPDLTGVPIHRDTLPDLAALRASGERAGRFDGVLMSAVLMHLPREEALRAVESALWLLRVGGRAIISVRAAVMGAARARARARASERASDSLRAGRSGSCAGSVRWRGGAWCGGRSHLRRAA